MASISNESIKSNRSHITPIDFKNAPKLPDSHKWTFSPECHYEDQQADQTVPIIDLHHTNTLAMIRKASEDWGMFQVINHGIPDSLLHEVEQQAKFLFSLPANQKLLAARSPDELTGYGVARISAFFAKKMWHEGFTIRGSPLKNVIQLWPDDHSRFCHVMEDYQQEMKKLSEKIIGLMIESLGLTQQDVKWFKPKSEGNEPPPHILQLNSYPECPDPGHAMGLAPHTDSQLLTLLLQSCSTNGLQVHKENCGWVPVHPLTNAVVVNTGDMMHIISNGRFKNPLHQAVVNRKHHRISIAYFYTPPKDIKISPPTKLIDSDHPLLYRPVTWKEYLDIKAAEFTNALEHIKI